MCTFACLDTLFPFKTQDDVCPEKGAVCAPALHTCRPFSPQLCSCGAYVWLGCLQRKAAEVVEAAGEKVEAAEEAPAAEKRPAKRRAVAKAKKPAEPLQPVEHPSHQKVHAEHATMQTLLGLNAGFRMM